MKKELFFAAVFALFLIASVSAATIDSRLNNAQNNETVKVIVKLTDSQQRDALDVSSFNHRMSIAQILSRNYNITYVGRTVNAISMELTKEQLTQLATRSDIASITKAPELHVLLQQSTSIINATLTWPLQTIDINMTGTGQTICIIDTGVNYTHPDLGGCTTSQFLTGNCSKVIGGYDFVNNDADPMDDNGHGTHVSGIATANGTINGVAPGAKIVMMKACDSGGNCGDGLRVIDGINWCNNNANLYNISVISMSIGDNEAYENNSNSICANSSDLLFLAVQSAIAKNISVVIASGNDHSSIGISYPACIPNVTAVGATNKSDSIADFSNRAIFMSLFAPGVDINSTWNDGNYNVDQGTSMATPHVAGAIAIINQLLAMENLTKTPMQITSILNSTGKRINDTTGVNYIRINVYKAVLALDTIAPIIALMSPSNNLTTPNSSIIFSANATDWQLANMTFTLMNSTGQTINQTVFNTTGQFNQTNITITNLSNGNYNWTFSAADNNSNTASITRYLIINRTYNMDSPADGVSTNSSATFNCSAQSEAELANITLVLANDTESITTQNQSVSGQANSTSVTYTFTKSYNNCSWYCNFGLANGTTVSLIIEKRTIIADKNPPVITLDSPDDADSFASTGGWADVDFKFHVSDNWEIDSCRLRFNDDHKDFSIDNKTRTIETTKTLSADDYRWNVTCTDTAGNTKVSESYDFTVNEDTSSNNDGGSSSSNSNNEKGATSTTTFSPSVASTNSGYNATLKKSQTIGFALPASPNSKHKLTLNVLTDVYVNISIESNPIYLILGKGQSVKINMTNSSVYDLYVKVNQIGSNSANITIQTINELISSMTNAANNSTNSTGTGNIVSRAFQNFKKSLMTWPVVWAGAIIVIVAIAAVAAFYLRHRRKHSKKVKKWLVLGNHQGHASEQ